LHVRMWLKDNCHNKSCNQNWNLINCASAVLITSYTGHQYQMSSDFDMNRWFFSCRFIINSLASVVGCSNRNYGAKEMKNDKDS
jgi:hypothetical protein